MVQERPLGFFEEPFSVDEPPTADNGRWVYLSPKWTGLIQTLVDLLDNDKVWSGTEEEIFQQRQWAISALDEKNPMENITYEIHPNGLSFRWVKGGNPLGDWIPLPAGLSGQPGQNAPIPAVEFVDNGSQIWIRFDVDGDGVPDYTSPNVKGAQGVQGAQGIQGLPGAAGADGTDGREITLTTSDGNVYWRYVDELESANRLLFAIPQDGGAGFDNVVALTLQAGLDAFALITDYYENGTQTLVLGIPQGIPGLASEMRIGTDNDVEYIQWRLVHPTTPLPWNNLIAIEDLRGEQGLQGVQGIQGAQGIQGISGVDSVSAVTLSPSAAATASYNSATRHITFGIPAGQPGQGSYAVPTQLKVNTDAHICAGVHGVIDGMWDAWEFFLAEVDQYRQGIKSMADTAAAIAEFLDSVYVPIVGGIDQIIETADGIAQSNLNELQLQTTDPDFISNIKENLYCRIIGETNKQFSEDIWNEWLDQDVSEVGFPWADLLNGFLRDNYTYKKAATEYYIEGLNTSNVCSVYGCNPPVPWEQVFDFKTSQSLLGFAQYSASRPAIQIDAYGVTSPAYTQSGSTTLKEVSGYKTLQYADATTRITGGSIYWENVVTGNSTGGSPGIFVRTTNSAGTSKSEGQTVADMPTIPVGNKALDFNDTTTYITTDQLRFYLSLGSRNASPLVNSTGSISKIVISGTGKNPFVA